MRTFYVCFALLLTTFGTLAAQTIITQNFNTGMPGTWTVVDGGGSTDTWFGTTNGYAGNTLNGSQFAFVNSDAAGNAPHPILSEQLISPTFNGNAYTQVFLEFDQFYRVYSNDRGYVEVWNGSAWVVLATISTDLGAWNAANHPTYNLTAYRNANMKVRFRYEDNTIWAWWWAVDNVHIYAPPANDAQITAAILPSSQCGYSANESITISGVNAGTATITSLPVHYRVNGGPVVNEVYSATIAPSATFNYTFTTTANLSAAGVYSVDVWSTLAGDGNILNDTVLATKTSNHIRISTFPYIEDFEANTGSWFVTGTLPSWAWGTPAKTTIQGAGSGQKAWVTGGLGATTYADNEHNQVEGPCFDLSNLSGPWVGLDTWWEAEFTWDGSNVQFSIDSGATWVTIGQTGDPYNWYTDDAIDGNPGGSPEGWSGRNNTNDGSQSWKRSVHSIAQLGGTPEVLVRVTFGSDGSVVDDGVAFDRFCLGRQPVMYLGPDTVGCDSVTIDAGPWSSWAWSTGDTTQTITVDSTGNYSATIFDSLGFPTADVILVTIEGPRTWDLGSDSALCNTDSIHIAAGAGQQGYLWSNGATTQQITATASGSFSVTTTSVNGCVRSDTVAYTFSTLNAGIDLPSDTLCRGVPVTLHDGSTGATTWFWNFGNGNLSTNANPVTVFPAGGTFTISLRVSDGQCTDSISRTIYVDVCTGIQQGNVVGMEAYPVPAAQTVWLSGLNLWDAATVVEIVDLRGQVVRSLPFPEGPKPERLEINVQDISEGIYLLRTKGVDKSWQQKLVIQR